MAGWLGLLGSVASDILLGSGSKSNQSTGNYVSPNVVGKDRSVNTSSGKTEVVQFRSSGNLTKAAARANQSGKLSGIASDYERKMERSLNQLGKQQRQSRRISDEITDEGVLRPINDNTRAIDINENFKILANQIGIIGEGFDRLDERFVGLEKKVSKTLKDQVKISTDQQKKVGQFIEQRLDPITDELDKLSNKVETHDRQIDRLVADMGKLRKDQSGKKQRDIPKGVLDALQKKASNQNDEDDGDIGDILGDLLDGGTGGKRGRGRGKSRSRGRGRTRAGKAGRFGKLGGLGKMAGGLSRLSGWATVIGGAAYIGNDIYEYFQDPEAYAKKWGGSINSKLKDSQKNTETQKLDNVKLEIDKSYELISKNDIIFDAKRTITLKADKIVLDSKNIEIVGSSKGSSLGRGASTPSSGEQYTTNPSSTTVGGLADPRSKNYDPNTVDRLPNKTFTKPSPTSTASSRSPTLPMSHKARTYTQKRRLRSPTNSAPKTNGTASPLGKSEVVGGSAGGLLASGNTPGFKAAVNSVSSGSSTGFRAAPGAANFDGKPWGAGNRGSWDVPRSPVAAGSFYNGAPNLEHHKIVGLEQLQRISRDTTRNFGAGLATPFGVSRGGSGAFGGGFRAAPGAGNFDGRAWGGGNRGSWDVGRPSGPAAGSFYGGAAKPAPVTSYSKAIKAATDTAGASPDFSEGGKQRYNTRIPASIRHNNPGATYPAGWMKEWGMTGVDIIGGGHKIANFKDARSGAAANFELFNRGYVGKPLGQAISKWSGGNSVGTYLGVIQRETGMGPDTIITKEMLRDPKIAVPLFKAMSQQEAGSKGFSSLPDTFWQGAHKQWLNGGKELPVEMTEAQKKSAKRKAAAQVSRNRRQAAEGAQATQANADGVIQHGQGSVMNGQAVGGVAAASTVPGIRGWDGSYGTSADQTGRLRGSQYQEGTLRYMGTSGNIEEFRYGTGGRSDSKGTMPYGTYQVTPESNGPIMQRMGGYSMNQGSMEDPVSGNRSGISIHRATTSGQLVSHGCMAIEAGQWDRVNQIIREAGKNGQRLAIRRNQDGSAELFDVNKPWMRGAVSAQAAAGAQQNTNVKQASASDNARYKSVNGNSRAPQMQPIVAYSKFAKDQLGMRVSEHPDFGGVGNMHKGAGHYEGRASDLNFGTGNKEAYNPAMASINEKLRRYGADKDKMASIFSGNPLLMGGGGHYDHAHLEEPRGAGQRGAISKREFDAMGFTPDEIALMRQYGGKGGRFGRENIPGRTAMMQRYAQRSKAGISTATGKVNNMLSRNREIIQRSRQAQSSARSDSRLQSLQREFSARRAGTASNGNGVAAANARAYLLNRRSRQMQRANPNVMAGTPEHAAQLKAKVAAGGAAVDRNLKRRGANIGAPSKAKQKESSPTTKAPKRQQSRMSGEGPASSRTAGIHGGAGGQSGGKQSKAPEPKAEKSGNSGAPKGAPGNGGGQPPSANYNSGGGDLPSPVNNSGDSDPGGPGGEGMGNYAFCVV